MNNFIVNNISSKDLFSPFVLVKEFGLDPKMVLNPAFDNVLDYQINYADNEFSNKINETTTEYEMSSNILSVDNIPRSAVKFNKDASSVELEHYDRRVDDNYDGTIENWIEFISDKISLDKNNFLIVDNAIVHFNDKGENQVRNLVFRKKIYDQYGILDFVRCIKILPNIRSFFV